MHIFHVIEIDNYVILNTLQNFHFVDYFIFVYSVGLKQVEPYIGKIFKTHMILITIYSNFIWNIVKKHIFCKIKLMIDFKFVFFSKTSTLCSIEPIFSSFIVLIFE